MKQQNALASAKLNGDVLQAISASVDALEKEHTDNKLYKVWSNFKKFHML